MADIFQKRPNLLLLRFVMVFLLFFDVNHVDHLLVFISFPRPSRVLPLLAVDRPFVVRELANLKLLDRSLFFIRASLILFSRIVSKVLIYLDKIFQIVFHLVDRLLADQTQAAFLYLLHFPQHLQLRVQPRLLVLQFLDVHLEVFFVVTAHLLFDVGQFVLVTFLVASGVVRRLYHVDMWVRGETDMVCGGVFSLARGVDSIKRSKGVVEIYDLLTLLLTFFSWNEPKAVSLVRVTLFVDLHEH